MSQQLPIQAREVRFSRSVKCGPPKSTSFEVWTAPKMEALQQKVGQHHVELIVERGQVFIQLTLAVEGKLRTFTRGLPLSSGVVVDIDYGESEPSKEARATLREDRRNAEIAERCPHWPKGATAHACEECNPEEIARLNAEYQPEPSEETIRAAQEHLAREGATKPAEPPTAQKPKHGGRPKPSGGMK